MNIPVNELETFKKSNEWVKLHGPGYRIVYFYYDDTYYVGAISKTIEGFMVNFAEIYPIEDESDIPKFISNEDLLNRYFEGHSEFKSVAIYKTTGELVAIEHNKTLKNKRWNK